MIHIACATDRRFAADCAAMLSSLMESNRPGAITVHLMHDDSLADSDVDLLGAIVRGAGGSFHVIALTSEIAPDLARSQRFPIRAWYRVLLPELLPDLSRVLYLDVDVLVTATLEPLWETDLGGYPLGAVTSPLYPDMVPRVLSYLGLPDARSYFNSGVLLIDLDAWRAQGTSRSVFSFARSHPASIWPDQDALNGALHARRLRLQPRWNAMPGIWELPAHKLPYSVADVRAASAAPAIVHFLGPHKPWHYRSRHPYRSEFFRHLERTHWRGRPIEGRSPWHAIVRPLPAPWAYRADMAVLGLNDWLDRTWAKYGPRFIQRVQRTLSHTPRLYALSRTVFRVGSRRLARPPKC